MRIDPDRIINFQPGIYGAHKTTPAPAGPGPTEDGITVAGAIGSSVCFGIYVYDS